MLVVMSAETMLLTRIVATPRVIVSGTVAVVLVTSLAGCGETGPGKFFMRVPEHEFHMMLVEGKRFAGSSLMLTLRVAFYKLCCRPARRPSSALQTQ